MKILVYGHNGWIGNQFIKLVEQKHDIIRGMAREENIKQELIEKRPDRVVLFIGRTHGKTDDGKEWTTIDYLEQPGKLVDNVRDNLFSPIAILMYCHQLGIHVTYLGTGCIFQYLNSSPMELTSLKTSETHPEFNEESNPNFFGSSYSIVKGFTDRMMRMFGDMGFKCLNLRIRMPITGEKNPRNFITKITTYSRICSIPNSMTVLDELLPAAVELIEKEYCGTLNFTNPGVISHNEILAMYKEIVDPGFNWVNMSVEEQSKILASARSNNHLDTSKLVDLCQSGVITCPVRPITESVRLTMHRYRDYVKPATRVLVTGGCGFIGSNFINYIMDKYPDINITNLDALYYCADVNNILPKFRSQSRYRFCNINLQNYEAVLNLITEYQPMYIVHFAAQSHVDTSFHKSIQFTCDNVLGTHNLLEAVRISNINLVKFIHVSTDEVYGESMLSDEEQHKTEHSILCPTNPYAATKAGAELIASSYHHSFKLPIIITRGNNVYGPNQYSEKLIPRFISQLKSGERLTVSGDGSQVRSFLHVIDTAAAFEVIMFNGAIGEIYNIGTHEEYSVKEVAKLCVQYWYNLDKLPDDKELESYITYIPDRPYNDKRYFISNNKLKSLGWDINLDFPSGLKQLIEAAKKQ